MEVSRAAMEVYEQINAEWDAAGIPTNHYDLPFRRSDEHHADPETCIQFIRWALAYYPGIYLGPDVSFEIVTGNRDTWKHGGRRNPWTVNPQKGYFSVSHMVSHWVWIKRRDRLKARGHQVPRAHHTFEHAEIELRFSRKLIGMLR